MAASNCEPQTGIRPYEYPPYHSMPPPAAVGYPQPAHPPAQKRYTHNPYASEPTTPTCATPTSNPLNMSLNSQSSCDSFTAFQQSYHPVYAPEAVYSDSVAYPVVNNLTEQFMSIIGSIAPTSCTARGRHLLVSVMRLQHMDKIQIIFDEIVPQLNIVVMDNQGCHVVRTLVEFLTTEQLEVFAANLSAKTVVDIATTSQHTRRVLQTLVERHKSNLLDNIISAIAANSAQLAKTQQGCIAVMRTVEHALPEQREVLMAALLPDLPALTMDPYGNYVVQCLLQHFDPTTCAAVVCSAFAGHWLTLSCNKFASNVMEKVVRLMVGPSRTELVQELVLNTSNVQCLMQDGFGNFVLQAIIDSSVDASEYRTICDVVRPLLHASPYGHKIEGKLKSKRFLRNGQSHHNANHHQHHTPRDNSSGYSSGAN